MLTKSIDDLATPVSVQTDPIYFPSGDDMGESGLQFYVCHLLCELFQSFFDSLERPMLISGNQYMYWDPADPGACIAPDVYIVADETLSAREVESWKRWEHDGKSPCLAIEVVAKEPKRAAKDYAPEMLQRYTELGVTELFRYDPHHGGGRRLGEHWRQLLTHWVRDGEGRMQEQTLLYKDRCKSVQFDLWLVHQPLRGLGLGTGPRGTAVWPTRAEAEAQRAEAEAQRAEAEAQRAEAEAQRAEAEAQRAEASEAREAELLAELARLRALHDAPR